MLSVLLWAYYLICLPNGLLDISSCSFGVLADSLGALADGDGSSDSSRDKSINQRVYTCTSKMAKIMDPILPILSILRYWAIILGSFGGLRRYLINST